MPRRRTALALLAAATATLGRVATAAPSAEPWPRWEPHDERSRLTVDHAPWASLLERYVRRSADGINRVAYAAIDPAAEAEAKAYVMTLASMPVTQLRRSEQLAYWINLYNVLTVCTVHGHYPVASIRDIDISPGLFSNGPWGAKLVVVEGEPLSLDDIEHRILRPIWRDSRIHYAVNCAALGCPNLQRQPFLAEGIDKQLDAAAMAYVNHPRGVSFDAERLRVSSLYVWYMADFGGSDREVIRHLMAYAEPELAMRLQARQRIDDDAYDWRLNDAGSG
ncbi:MAG: DUF547 domain-containing protein [Geminicoccaceae bacterium]